VIGSGKVERASTRSAHVVDEPNDIVPQLLRSIRDEIRSNGERIDRLGERVDRNSDRIDQLAQETTRGFTMVAEQLGGLSRRVDETNERLDRVEHHLHAFHGANADRLATLEDKVARLLKHVKLDD
jgi:chromosome segregation ATPase